MKICIVGIRGPFMAAALADALVSVVQEMGSIVVFPFQIRDPYDDLDRNIPQAIPLELNTPSGKLPVYRRRTFSPASYASVLRAGSSVSGVLRVSTRSTRRERREARRMFAPISCTITVGKSRKFRGRGQNIYRGS